MQIVAACDASPLGLSTVLSHIMPDEQERPIVYASRTLTVAERGYSHVVYAVTKFHNYQPLSHLFNQQKPFQQQHQQGFKDTYHYTICHKPDRSLSNADALSRLPTPRPSVNNYIQCCLR